MDKKAFIKRLNEKIREETIKERGCQIRGRCSIAKSHKIRKIAFEEILQEVLNES